MYTYLSFCLVYFVPINNAKPCHVEKHTMREAYVFPIGKFVNGTWSKFSSSDFIPKVEATKLCSLVGL